MGKIKRLIKNLLLYFKKPKWQKIEYFDEAWKNRIREMAESIDPGDRSVCDIGCGQEWLRDFLPPGIKYYPVDYTKRSDETIVCDLNKKELPPEAAMQGTIFCSGVLEYIVDYSWFLKSIGQHSKKIILSYCTREEIPDFSVRTGLAWKNHLISSEIVDIMQDCGFSLAKTSMYNKNSIFVFIKNNLHA